MELLCTSWCRVVRAIDIQQICTAIFHSRYSSRRLPLQSNAALEGLLTVAEMKHDIPGLLRVPTFLGFTSQRVADLRKGNSLPPTEANGRSPSGMEPEKTVPDTPIRNL